MYKSQLTQAYRKISLSPEFAEQAKSKLIAELSQSEKIHANTNEITLAEQDNRARRNIGAWIGAAAALAVIAAGFLFIPKLGIFGIGTTSSENTESTTSSGITDSTTSADTPTAEPNVMTEEYLDNAPIEFAEGTITVQPLSELIEQNDIEYDEIFGSSYQAAIRVIEMTDEYGFARFGKFSEDDRYTDASGKEHKLSTDDYWQLDGESSYMKDGCAVLHYLCKNGGEMFITVGKQSDGAADINNIIRRVEYDEGKTFAPPENAVYESRMAKLYLYQSENFYSNIINNPREVYVGGRVYNGTNYFEAQWQSNDGGDVTSFAVSMKGGELSDLTDIMAKIMYEANALAEYDGEITEAETDNGTLVINPMHTEPFGGAYYYDVDMKSTYEICSFCGGSHTDGTICEEAMGYIQTYALTNPGVIDLVNQASSVKVSYGVEFYDFHNSEENFAKFIIGEPVDTDIHREDVEKQLEEAAPYKIHSGRSYSTDNLDYLQGKLPNFLFLSIDLTDANGKEYTVELLKSSYRHILGGLHFNSLFPAPSAEFCGRDTVFDYSDPQLSSFYAGKLEDTDGTEYFGGFRAEENYVLIHGVSSADELARIGEIVYGSEVKHYSEQQ